MAQPSAPATAVSSAPPPGSATGTSRRPQSPFPSRQSWRTHLLEMSSERRWKNPSSGDTQVQNKPWQSSRPSHR